MVKWYQDVNAYRASKGMEPEPVPDQYKPGAKVTATLSDVVEEGQQTENGAGDDDSESSESEAETEAPNSPPRKRGKQSATSAQANGTKASAAPKGAKGKTAPATPAAAVPAAVAPSPAEDTPSKRKRAPSLKKKQAVADAAAQLHQEEINHSITVNTPTGKGAVADKKEKRKRRA